MMTDPSEIRYAITKDLPIADLRENYLDVGWINAECPDAFLEKMVRHSFAVSAAFDGDRLIGSMRALSDGVSDAYLLDLVVHHDYRCRGIGRAVLANLAAAMCDLGIGWIVCVGVPGTESFYQNSPGVKMQNFTPYRFFENPQS